MISSGPPNWDHLQNVIPNWYHGLIINSEMATHFRTHFCIRNIFKKKRNYLCNFCIAEKSWHQKAYAISLLWNVILMDLRVWSACKHWSLKGQRILCLQIPQSEIWMQKLAIWLLIDVYRKEPVGRKNNDVTETSKRFVSQQVQWIQSFISFYSFDSRLIIYLFSMHKTPY